MQPTSEGKASAFTLCWRAGPRRQRGAWPRRGAGALFIRGCIVRHIFQFASAGVTLCGLVGVRSTADNRHLPACRACILARALSRARVCPECLQPSIVPSGGCLFCQECGYASC